MGGLNLVDGMVLLGTIIAPIIFVIIVHMTGGQARAHLGAPPIINNGESKKAS